MRKLIKIKPMFNRIVTTMDVYDDDMYINGILQPGKVKGAMKEYQTVLAVGDTVRGIYEGDVVCINPMRYAVMKHEDKSLRDGIIGDNPIIGYKFETIEINGRQCLMLYDQDISFVVVESEPIESSKIRLPDNQVITN